MMLRRIGQVLPVAAKTQGAEIVLQRGQAKPIKPKKPLLKLGPPKPPPQKPGPQKLPLPAPPKPAQPPL
jgi:hypothetical protein